MAPPVSGSFSFSLMEPLKLIEQVIQEVHNALSDFVFQKEAHA